MADTFQTLSVNQGAVTGYGTDYPFRVTPPATARYLLGDLWLSFTDDNNLLTYPLILETLTGFNSPSGDKDIVIKDSAGVTVFDTTSAISRLVSPWGNNLITLQWTGTSCVIRCTMHTVPPPWSPGTTWASSITVNAELDARTYQRMPKRTRAIHVNGTTLTGPVMFTEGYNISITTQTTVNDGSRNITKVKFDATPGGGLGVLPGCTDIVPVLRQFNGATADSYGRLNFSGDDTYRLQRPAALISEDPRVVNIAADGLNTSQSQAALQVHNDGAPCCTCEDYANTYEGLRNVYNEYATIGAGAGSIRDQYAANVDRWNAQRACRLSNTLRLILLAEPKGVLYVGANWCNNSTCCVVPLLMRLTFEYLSDDVPIDVSASAQVLCRETKRTGADTNYQEMSYQPEINWPIVDSYFNLAVVDGLSYVRTRIVFPQVSDADTVRVTVSTHMPAVFDPQTGEACVLPSPEAAGVPASVQALWADNPPKYPVRAIKQAVSPVSMTAGCCGTASRETFSESFSY